MLFIGHRVLVLDVSQYFFSKNFLMFSWKFKLEDLFRYKAGEAWYLKPWLLEHQLCTDLY